MYLGTEGYLPSSASSGPWLSLLRLEGEHCYKIGFQRLVHGCHDEGIEAWLEIGRFDGDSIVLLVRDHFLNCSSLFLGSHVRQPSILSAPAESKLRLPLARSHSSALPSADGRIRRGEPPVSVLRRRFPSAVYDSGINVRVPGFAFGRIASNSPINGLVSSSRFDFARNATIAMASRATFC